MGRIPQIKHPSFAGRRKRVGRGIGSGHGKTCGRGTKGQKSRSGDSIHPRFEGGQTSLILHLPKLGGFKRTNQLRYGVINVGELNQIKDRDQFDLIFFKQIGIIDRKHPKVKVLGQGELSRKITVYAHAFSQSAKEKIEAAGGQAVVVED